MLWIIHVLISYQDNNDILFSCMAQDLVTIVGGVALQKTDCYFNGYYFFCYWGAIIGL